MQRQKKHPVTNLNRKLKNGKKKLGTERKLKINLEKKVHKLSAQLNKYQVSFESSNLLRSSSDLSFIATPINSTASEFSCYICIQTIPNYEPRFFNRIEMNPSCSNCCSELGNEDDPKPEPSLQNIESETDNFSISKSLNSLSMHSKAFPSSASVSAPLAS